ncbi:MAG TPA: hypothetical protein PLJ38_07470, partial [bacterium]|nr:hypothetical protein [bacterium]
YTSTGATWGSTTQKKVGNKSLKYTSQTTSSDGRTVEMNSFVNVTAGKKYQASVWFISTSATFNDVHIKIGIKWYDSGDNLLSSIIQADADGLVLSAQSTWQKQTFANLKAPANAAKAKLIFYIWRSGSNNRIVYIDAASLTEIPSINFSTPASFSGSHDTSSQTITVSGWTSTTSTGDNVELFVNGVSQGTTNLTSDNGNWSKNVTLTGYGDSVVAKLTSSTRVDYDTITVNYFPTPVIEISFPSYTSHDTFYQVITVSGTTLNTKSGDTVEIFTNTTKNGVTTITALNGTFSGTAGLSAIGDSIIVKLYDSFGRNAYDTITVNLFDTPSIKIISPSTNHDTKTSIIVISGTTNNTYSGETITIKTNTTINTTIILASQNANWSGTAALTGLGDSIVVSLQDRFGRMYYDTITVNRWISGFGSASLTSASAVYVLDTITAQITISSTLSGTFMDSITIELPANMSWSGSSGDVTLSGAGFPGGELITISGTGAENDSYIITIHNGQIKSGSDGVVSISNLVCDGGKDHLFGNGAFRFVTKTSAAGNSPTAISSQPQITVNIGIGSLLISEVCAQYAGVADDVFVELYNPTNSKLNLQDVYLKYSAAATQPNTTSSGTQALRR